MQSTVVLVVGTRPNFVKAAPVLHALSKDPDITPVLVHSGQHFDAALSTEILQDLSNVTPDVLFDTRDKDGWNTDAFAVQFDLFLRKNMPSLVLVFGDVDTTRIAAEVTKKNDIALGHVESGLRSFDDRMPEEANRIRTDGLSDLLFVTEQSGLENIQKESLDADVHLVGNTMIDSLYTLEERIADRASVIQDDMPTIVVTLHRRETITDKAVLELLLKQLTECSAQYRILWPLHPHTKKMIESFDLSHYLEAFTMKEPAGYIDFLATVKNATAVITDSGGIQEEATCLGVPCFTVRKSTERPVTVEEGTNTLVPPDTLVQKSLLTHIQGSRACEALQPDLWDGKAADRIAAIVQSYLRAQSERTGISAIGQRSLTR
ncbi:MAG: UDP-N-acetylglucosamine 2-epimerase (non-hydrolyzing) [Candidatus Peribacter sp.]|jgi:UDP-N-acetylglucosamine 2-epimerase (non-hydrolysing)|nr:UDP-N-acetylglucosamine 2-epimerase (non-hydrolyzing) [Candidatus Peribacter sp.]MBT4392620.1 UDP-N-acetylglucosamine 2-epimerase (non-hydrolyzing) [Candidatus Peribacter sp.]MBT4601489.1 UDP-N-acetylglucosamine 2-epimerase (non-hydrolyzing) [Candidatus Peribacter sp.]MBT5149510.1 UDP-N-acetylglucosamine 2-epimerase (non-hydrolyzing) [Candidatus Peribacter sp.]MBT5638643.1 UDP-N-acetylglucosamine 2-epimerase (non-hydrolyzing) [Candidatus Peribacter sp.]